MKTNQKIYLKIKIFPEKFDFKNINNIFIFESIDCIPLYFAGMIGLDIKVNKDTILNKIDINYEFIDDFKKYTNETREIFISGTTKNDIFTCSNDGVKRKKEYSKEYEDLMNELNNSVAFKL